MPLYAIDSVFMPTTLQIKKKKERKKVLHNSMNPGITKYLPQNLSAYAN